MSNVDLENYKNAWKNERSFDERKLSENEISMFMQSSSRSIVTLFRKGLLFDIFFKIVLLISLVFLFFLMQGQSAWRFTVVFQIILILAGIFWQKHILHKIPDQSEKGSSAFDKLRIYIDFYYRYYIVSIYIGALSSSFFFLIGSIYYLHYKYLEIPQLQIDDFVVCGLGLVFSFGISAFFQLKQNKFHIKQLEESLREIEENTINELSIEKYKTNRIKNMAIIGIAMIIGVILFLYLIFRLK